MNNAAGNFLCLTEDLSLNAFKSVVDIDLVGTFNFSKVCRRVRHVCVSGFSVS